MRAARPLHHLAVVAFCAAVFSAAVFMRADTPSPTPEEPFEAVTPASSATPPGATPTPAASASPARLTPAPTPALTPTVAPRVLYPAGGSNSPGTGQKSGGAPDGSGLFMTFVVLLVFCGVGFYVWRRQGHFATPNRGPRKLVVTESRALGNRQFLIVVEYENERLLLGVTPGRIDYLCPLSPGAPPTTSARDKMPEFILPV